MDDTAVQALVVVLLVLVAPILASALRQAIPLVVVELLLGYVVGADVLDLVTVTGALEVVREAGMACLFLVVGVHIDLRTLRGRPIRLATRGWLFALFLALVAGGVLVLDGVAITSLFIAIPLVTTSLGAVMSLLRGSTAAIDPVVRERTVVGGTVAELGPIALIAILLGATSPAREAVALGVFAAAVVVLLVLSRTARVRALARHVGVLHGATSQGLHRMALALLMLLLVVGDALGLDLVLGAFATGLVYRALLAHTDVEARVLGELDAIAYGIFVPVYFVLSGAAISLAALGDDWRDWARVPLFLALLAAVRVVPAIVLHRSELGRAGAAAVGLLWAVTLPLVLASTELAVAQGHMLEVNAVALTAAAVLGMILFPPIAMRLLQRPSGSPAARIEPHVDAARTR